MSKLYVVGIGPGDCEGMTLRARRVLEESEIIIGYTIYVDLVRDLFPGKEFLTTPMRRETQRVELALTRAAEGRTVSLICSGDAGVYGMSGLARALAPNYPGVEVETIPGVSAVLSGAAVLGAPLMHDFAVISLSDLLTPWETIEKRLEAAAVLRGAGGSAVSASSAARTASLKASAMRTGSPAAAIAVLASTASAPSSIASAAWEGRPIPASTTTGM